MSTKLAEVELGTTPEFQEAQDGSFPLRDGETLWTPGRPRTPRTGDTDSVTPAMVVRVGRTATAPSLQVLQQFEGTVWTLGKEEFVAILRDMTHPERPEEQATFSIDEVARGDQSLIQEGAVFHWTIAYESRPYRRRVSEIRFRRMPLWSESDLSKARAEGAELHRLFGADA